MAMPKIQAEINRLRAEAGEFAGQVQLSRVLAELSKIAFADPGELYGENGELKNPKQMTANMRAALMGIDISEINVGGETIGTIKKIKLNDKNKALDMLMRHLGGYEVDNKQKATTVQLIVDIVDDDEPLTQPDQQAQPEIEDDDEFVDD
jgi:phage terminase small subunit